MKQPPLKRLPIPHNCIAKPFNTNIIQYHTYCRMRNMTSVGEGFPFVNLGLTF